MFPTIDLEKQLIKEKNKTDNNVLNFASDILLDDYNQEKKIKLNLSNSVGRGSVKIKSIDLNKVFSIHEIKKIAINYRLRFLPSKYAKKIIPEEAIFKIKKIEKENHIEIKEFYILAPSEAFDLEDVNKDPLLFIPLENNRYLLIHKWGNDLSWLKKIFAFPLRNIETILLSIGIFSLLITLITPTWLILNSAEIDMGYFGYHRAAWLIYSYILILSITTFICFSQGIYPSTYQWNKKTYN